MDGVSTKIIDGDRPYVELSESTLVVFIPKDDDSFASQSHYCMAIVETPEGVWLFNKRLA